MYIKQEKVDLHGWVIYNQGPNQHYEETAMPKLPEAPVAKPETPTVPVPAPKAAPKAELTFPREMRHKKSGKVFKVSKKYYEANAHSLEENDQ